MHAKEFKEKILSKCSFMLLTCKAIYFQNAK